ncbi:uncharacterized protein LOC116379213 [Anarrhichthys ocellatus]|uniref:uncharacterized protein LOC116379211 n=1 Tax=Anarrhichthys ocellatus TaxID=433405 RepID=UPI0012EDBACA|nr:uncharacterized protein LOC116379211 [Anarrhichthys ocellatus]XP_031697013.1 uncharacterized protein LOC116379213 [Anarrhichthys ocellatus]
MLNFQSVFVSLMVIMFNLNQAALLSIQLLVMCQVFAEIDPVEHRDELVSRGDSVIFTCNISETNVTQIKWTRGRSVFVFSILLNNTFSNFTSHKITIDKSLPSKMNIANVQHDDAGTYRCFLNGIERTRAIEWNLNVTVEHEEISPLWYSLYITAAIGFLLCVITTAVCLYRKLRTRTQNPVQDQFYLHSVEETSLPPPQDGTGSGTNNKRGSQYAERLNSIYGL